MSIERGTSDWRNKFWGPLCSFKGKVFEIVPGVVVHVDERIEHAILALGQVFRMHKYEVRRKSTGAFNCRRIHGTNIYSSHAYGIAVDVNWDTNPYVKGKLITDLTKEIVNDVQSIKTENGVQVWRWGGDWDWDPKTSHKYYDAMHWEIICTPEEIESGIISNFSEKSIDVLPILKRGAKGSDVKYAQKLLGILEDGKFGALTEAAVKSFQDTRGLVADGIIGPATWTALINKLPILTSSDSKPNKNWGEIFLV